MTRSDRISANVGRLVASCGWADVAFVSQAQMVADAVKVAEAIEDAVDKAEREHKGINPKEVV